MTAAWPETLPQYVQQQGYNESPPDQVVESPTDGAVKTRRRFTTAWRPFQVTIFCTEAQAVIFDGFYTDDLAGGALPFTWVHPRTRAAGTFKFRKPVPRYAENGGFVAISFAMFQIG